LYSFQENSFARPRRVFLIGLVLPGNPGYVVEEHLDELAQLAESAGAQVVGRAVQNRKAIDRATYIGKGKVEEIAAAARELKADLLVFDDDLAPSQVKNVEEATKMSAMDRSGLILEIFSQRARSREARTQVGLARLKYKLPRLTRQWSHLSRQGGGAGQRGGEGEKQLEQDRRVIRTQIRRMEEDLEKIERTRGVQRHGRREVPTVALTGYTNAGKSTLFNRLTHAGTLAENRLFATLDAKLRRGALNAPNAPRDGDNDGNGQENSHGQGRDIVVFSDTVGFIRKLPHHLVSSFRSTLGEIADADVVLHVIDGSHPHWREQKEVAEQVLDELGVDRARVIEVFNKSDLVAPGEARNGESVWVSAATGQGLDDLRAAVAQRLAGVEEPAAPGSLGADPAETLRAPRVASRHGVDTP
jgi:GTP-binding protein HflX